MDDSRGDGDVSAVGRLWGVLEGVGRGLAGSLRIRGAKIYMICAQQPCGKIAGLLCCVEMGNTTYKFVFGRRSDVAFVLLLFGKSASGRQTLTAGRNGNTSPCDHENRPCGLVYSLLRLIHAAVSACFYTVCIHTGSINEHGVLPRAIFPPSPSRFRPGCVIHFNFPSG